MENSDGALVKGLGFMSIELSILGSYIWILLSFNFGGKKVDVRNALSFQI